MQQQMITHQTLYGQRGTATYPSRAIGWTHHSLKNKTSTPTVTGNWNADRGAGRVEERRVGGVQEKLVYDLLNFGCFSFSHRNRTDRSIPSNRRGIASQRLRSAGDEGGVAIRHKELVRRQSARPHCNMHNCGLEAGSARASPLWYTIPEIVKETKLDGGATRTPNSEIEGCRFEASQYYDICGRSASQVLCQNRSNGRMMTSCLRCGSRRNYYMAWRI